MNYASFQANLRYTFPFRALVGVGSFVDYGISGAQKMPSGNEVKIFEEEALDRLNAGVAVEAGFPVLDIGSVLLKCLSPRDGVSQILKVSLIRIIRKVF